MMTSFQLKPDLGTIRRPVRLAHEPAFVLGSLHVTPALRLVTRADGATTIIEPRLMQVLTAMCRAQGAILSRDDLIECCWNSVSVGNDAINRVIVGLRKLAAGSGEGSFSIETIRKVGYRLIDHGSEPISQPGTDAGPRQPDHPGPDPDLAALPYSPGAVPQPELAAPHRLPAIRTHTGASADYRIALALIPVGILLMTILIFLG